MPAPIERDRLVPQIEIEREDQAADERKPRARARGRRSADRCASQMRMSTGAA